MSHLKSAFEEVCNGARATECWYVCLMADTPYYGGPQDGGWWDQDTHCVAYQEFPTREAASVAMEAVEALAEKLSGGARDEYGDQCLREIDWCDDRGLEPDYLPEPDGPETYYVVVSETVPAPAYGCRHYE